jgi:uncharacterized protein (DUF1501 family)
MNEPVSVEPKSTTSYDIERRRFLQGALSSLGVLALPAGLPGVAGASALKGSPQPMQAPPLARAASANRSLVIVNLVGGNDALNTLVPGDLTQYRTLRGPLALRDDQLRAINGQYLHGALVDTFSRARRGDVAFVPGFGVPGASMSHFSSTARWMSATNSDLSPTGWLGRALDDVARTEPFAGLHIGSAVPLLLRGNTFRALSLPDNAAEMFGGERTRPRTGGGIEPHRDNLRMFAAIDQMANGRSDSSLTSRWAVAGSAAVDNAVTLAPAIDTLPEPTSDQTPRVIRRLHLAAALLNMNLGTRVISIAHGGFDTHAGQLGQHERLLTELDGGLKRFFSVLSPARAALTTVFVVTEFGRRVSPNASGGTDHGGASLAMLLGSPVSGGLRTSLPALSGLDINGNQPINVDGRLLFSDLVTWLGLPSDLGVSRTPNSIGALE